jgi:hypothetical protein
MADSVMISVVSGQHSFFGSLANRGLRVLELLNDQQTAFLHLHDVAVFRGFEGACLQQLCEARFPKAAIDLVLLQAEHHEAALRRQHALVEKVSFPAVALLGQFEVHGTHISKPPFDERMVLRDESSPFFPLVSPRVVRLGAHQETISAGTALVNKTKVSLFFHEQASLKAIPRAPQLQSNAKA